MNFVLEPNGHGESKTAKAGGRKGQIGFKQTIKFKQWFVVKCNVVKIFRMNAASLQTIRHGVYREIGIVFLARKPFFLRSGDEAAVHNQRRGAVVIKRGNTQNARHRLNSKSIKLVA